MSTIEKFVHYIHEYERSKSNKEIFRCVHPRCTHYMRREFLIGKESICNKCKNLFVLTLAQLRNKRPVCEFCSKSPKSKELRAARDLATEVIMKQDDLPDELKQLLIENTLE